MLRFLIVTLAVLAVTCLPTESTGQQDYYVSCPGQWGEVGHTPGSETDWYVGLGWDYLNFSFWPNDPPAWAPLEVSYGCVCQDECPPQGDFPEYWPDDEPAGYFRWHGSVHSYHPEFGDPGVTAWMGQEHWLDLRVTSVDMNCDCRVDMADFVIFAGCFVAGPPPPPSTCMYLSFTTGETVPPADILLSDFVMFARHFGHECTPGDCDPQPPPE